jgi:AcrR family transcriptional regulator
MTKVDEEPRRTRERILEVTAQLLAASPAGGVSNRAVCEAAGVTPPTLYHHFGDKDGLEQAVVADAFERYLARKREELGRTDDVAADFLHGWDMHVAFGVENPVLYELMWNRPLVRRTSPQAAVTARTELLNLLRRIEAAGRLRLPVEVATDVAESAATGVTLHLIHSGRPASDPAAAVVRDAIIAAIIGPAASYGQVPASPGLSAAAARLRDELPHGPVATLRASETALLHDWLDALADPTP